VEAGEEVLVTRRGKPVARLMPAEGATALDELVRRGIVRMPTKQKTMKRPTTKLEGPGPTLSDIVIEQRRR
jgi:antitoxin (DNA-binding transcriptional repressor) of toxin-antitoxin stability system